MGKTIPSFDGSHYRGDLATQHKNPIAWQRHFDAFTQMLLATDLRD